MLTKYTEIILFSGSNQLVLQSLSLAYLVALIDSANLYERSLVS